MYYSAYNYIIYLLSIYSNKLGNRFSRAYHTHKHIRAHTQNSVCCAAGAYAARLSHKAKPVFGKVCRRDRVA